VSFTSSAVRAVVARSSPWQKLAGGEAADHAVVADQLLENAAGQHPLGAVGDAVANHCVLLPVSIAQQPWLHLGTTLIFVVLHGWLLWRLAAFVRHHAPIHPSTLQLLFPLAMLLPTLYGAAHMRYLIPIIPVLLLCAFELRVVRGFADNYKPNMLA
jgi:hypothetical protein